MKNTPLHTYQANYKIVTIPNAESLSHSCWWECEMGIATLGSSLAVSYQRKPAIATEPSSWTVGYLFQRNEDLSSHKKLFTNVHRGFIFNSQALEIIQMVFRGYVSISWNTTQQ